MKSLYIRIGLIVRLYLGLSPYLHAMEQCLFPLGTKIGEHVCLFNFLQELHDSPLPEKHTGNI